MTHFGLFGGYRKWHLGCPNQNSKTTFQHKYPPKNPQLDTLEAILDSGKVIFGHFIDFGHFPIEIPIKAKNSQNTQNDPFWAFWGVPKMALRVPESKF